MVNLACGLRDRGHIVEMFIYFPQEAFFRPIIDQAKIPVHETVKGRGFSLKVLRCLMRLLRTRRYDAAISFLNTPNIYCELAKLASPRIRLIVSERSSNALDRLPALALARRLLHLLANNVVTNSVTHGNWLRRLPWMRERTKTIYNGFSMHHPPLDRKVSGGQSNARYLVIGRVDPGKNGLQLIKALIAFREKHGRSPLISWAGRREDNRESREYVKRMEALLDQHPDIAANWVWLGERDDIPELLAAHDALLHPSLYEGLPNVICEAFIAGCPVIASNVCDHPLLVGSNLRGLLFDPLSVESICNAIERFGNLNEIERANMSKNARRYAEEHLTIEQMVTAYESLLR